MIYILLCGFHVYILQLYLFFLRTSKISIKHETVLAILTVYSLLRTAEKKQCKTNLSYLKAYFKVSFFRRRR